jgi:hypothetical protein
MRGLRHRAGPHGVAARRLANGDRSEPDPRRRGRAASHCRHPGRTRPWHHDGRRRRHCHRGGQRHQPHDYGFGSSYEVPAHPRCAKPLAGCRTAGAAVQHRTLGPQEAAARSYLGALGSQLAPDPDQVHGCATRTSCHHTTLVPGTGIPLRPVHPTRLSRLPAPGSRLPAPGSRLPAPGSRLPAPGSRLPAPGSRLQAPGSRLQAPGSRLQAPGSRLQAPGSRLQAPGSRRACFEGRWQRKPRYVGTLRAAGVVQTAPRGVSSTGRAAGF